LSSLTCERCGGSLRAENGTSLLRCPYCGDAARLAPALADDLRTYRQGVAAHLAEAEEQALFARAYANVSGANAPGAAALPPAEPITGAKCASCGASNGFGVGATFSTCTHCGASLLATPQVQTRGLSAAARAARAARLEALKSERYFAVRLARKNRFFSYVPAVFAIGSPAIAAPFFALSDLPDASTQALGAGATSVLALGIVGAVMLWRKGQRARAANAIASVAPGYVGGPVIGVEGIAEWLNLHWCDAYYVYDLSSASDSQCISCTVRGYQALVIANPLPGPDRPFLELILSAWFDGQSEQGSGPTRKGAADARSVLQAQGFTLRSGPSGIHATIGGDLVREQLKGSLDLDQALESLAQLASSQGGKPADDR
jgi:DNA-directed RNA polymerase subunit RPC12/RpoP